jgi:uncharacterized membrane protein
VSFKKLDWIIIGGLLLLSAIPAIAGIMRLGQFYSGTLGPQHSRFQMNPILVSTHIVAVTIYSLLGALQFSRAFRRKFATWHRQVGKVLIVLGLISALTGIWMTLVLPSANFDGIVVYFVRLLVGSLMTVFIIFGINSIRKREFAQHGQWMLRAYALGLGAGTQVLTHIPWILFPQIQGETARAIFMTIAWVINAAVAESVIQIRIFNR